MQKNGIASVLPAQTTKGVAQSKSLVDEYKLKLQKAEKELGFKTAELLQKGQKMQEL